jgi:hypothetical protein
MIKAGIIDDGIGGKLGEESPQWEWKKNQWVSMDAGQIVPDSHGSCIAAIIRAYNPQIVLSGLKVLDTRGWGGLELWMDALSRAEKGDTFLWNLSNGTTDFFQYDQVQKSIDKVVLKNRILVAARNNGDFFTLPACLYTVVGVAYDENLLPNTVMVNPVVENDINIRANLDFPVSSSSATGQIRRDCSSYQTAAVTGILSRHMISLNGERERIEFFTHLADYLRPEQGDSYSLVPWEDEPVSDAELEIPVLVVKETGKIGVRSWCQGMAAYMRKQGSYAVYVTEQSNGDSFLGPDRGPECSIWKEARKYGELSWMMCWKRIWQKHRCDIIVSVMTGEETCSEWDMYIDLEHEKLWMMEDGKKTCVHFFHSNAPEVWSQEYEQVYKYFEVTT